MKPRVVFPFVEAGFGHIMPQKSIAETFKKKYGDRVEVILSDFFSETGDMHLKKYEKMLSNQVRLYNRFPAVGYFATFLLDIFGSVITSFFAIRFTFPFAYKKAIKHMADLDPDVIFSTHWSTNYYAMHLKNKPFSVVYSPDADINKFFAYKADMHMISMPKGYKTALKMRRFNQENLKLVNFLIRNEAFSIERDKKKLRRELGLPLNNFTVLLVEGAYGIGKMEKICKNLIKEDLPVTVIPVCGKNEKLYKKLGSLISTGSATFKPRGYADDILKLHAAADLFCGKSGNILAEATFFGVPTLVTNCTHKVEYRIADHYINTVGCAVKETRPKKATQMIKDFINEPSLLKPYTKAANNYHNHFGSEEAADILFEEIKKIYPDI